MIRADLLLVLISFNILRNGIVRLTTKDVIRSYSCGILHGCTPTLSTIVIASLARSLVNAPLQPAKSARHAQMRFFPLARNQDLDYPRYRR